MFAINNVQRYVAVKTSFYFEHQERARVVRAFFKADGGNISAPLNKRSNRMCNCLMLLNFLLSAEKFETNIAIDTQTSVSRVECRVTTTLDPYIMVFHQVIIKWTATFKYLETFDTLVVLLFVGVQELDRICWVQWCRGTIFAFPVLTILPPVSLDKFRSVRRNIGHISSGASMSLIRLVVVKF